MGVLKQALHSGCFKHQALQMAVHGTPGTIQAGSTGQDRLA